MESPTRKIQVGDVVILDKNYNNSSEVIVLELYNHYALVSSTGGKDEPWQVMRYRLTPKEKSAFDYLLDAKTAEQRESERKAITEPDVNQKARIVDVCNWITQQSEFKDVPVTDPNSIFYHVAPVTYATLIDRFHESHRNGARNNEWMSIQKGLPECEMIGEEYRYAEVYAFDEVYLVVSAHYHPAVGFTVDGFDYAQAVKTFTILRHVTHWMYRQPEPSPPVRFAE